MYANQEKSAREAPRDLPAIPKELLDQFVSVPISAEAIQAASMAFKNALIERAIGANRVNTLAILRARSALRSPPISATDSIRDQNAQIATAAEEQHQVAEEINQHIAQIHKDAQEVEALAQHAHADAASLRGLSGELFGHVSRFKY